MLAVKNTCFCNSITLPNGVQFFQFNKFTVMQSVSFVCVSWLDKQRACAGSSECVSCDVVCRDFSKIVTTVPEATFIVKKIA